MGVWWRQFVMDRVDVWWKQGMVEWVCGKSSDWGSGFVIELVCSEVGVQWS